MSLRASGPARSSRFPVDKKQVSPRANRSRMSADTVKRADASRIRFVRVGNGDEWNVVSGRPARMEAAMMRINTTRFGRLEIDPHERLVFPAGILGLEDCRE